MKRDYQIIDEGAKWIAPYIRQIIWEGRWSGYISGVVWNASLRNAYEAGLRDEDCCPPSTPFREESQWIRKHRHAAYMVGLTDERTKAELAKDREIRALCSRIEDMVTDSQLAARGFYVWPPVLLLKGRND